MAILWIRKTQELVCDPAAIARVLGETGIIYEVWGTDRMPAGLSNRNLTEAQKRAVLEAFAPDIDRRSRECGYKTSDVVSLYPDTPNLERQNEQYARTHMHTDDEVRFIVQGRGVFTLRPGTGPRAGQVIDAEFHPGDFVTIPANFRHEFVLCPDKQITAIRLFTDPAGWVAHYS